jgi:hypothetical protein
MDNHKNDHLNELDEYIKVINLRCENKIIKPKNPIKIEDQEISIPTIKDYTRMCNFNYNVSQLKTIAKNYKLKVGGNKNELFTRIYSFLCLSSHVTKIQSLYRGFIQKKYNFFHGPAFKNRNISTNQCDFITLEPLNDIPLDQFISYKDVDGFTYGFDIVSLYNLIFKSGKDIRNPYNRNVIPEYVFSNIKSIIKYGRILKRKINLQIEDETANLSNEKNIELRALALFQNIDALGNYSNCAWFLSLNRNNLVKFMRELSDIWHYRAQLTIQIKRNICPPLGDPFRNINLNYILNEPNIWHVRKQILEILEKIVNSGIDKDSKTLGAYYVLGALTLVNEDAANAMPWLFQSLSYY